MICFSVTGRSDARGCGLTTGFARELGRNNVIFRIPTPCLDLGWWRRRRTAYLRANLAANAAQKSSLGIHGSFNTSGNDGTITRFGWKAQNKSLLIFSGEAYNVEQGVSNEVFPIERSAGFRAALPIQHRKTYPSGEPAEKHVRTCWNSPMFTRLSAPPTQRTRRLSRRTAQHSSRKWMQFVPLAHTDDWNFPLHWHVQRYVSSVL